MFILNPKSILRKTISVGEDLKIYLTKHGYSPISRDDSTWIFISNKDITKLIQEYRDLYLGGEL